MAIDQEFRRDFSAAVERLKNPEPGVEMHLYCVDHDLTLEPNETGEVLHCPKMGCGISVRVGFEASA